MASSGWHLSGTLQASALCSQNNNVFGGLIGELHSSSMDVLILKDVQRVRPHRGLLSETIRPFIQIFVVL